MTTMTAPAAHTETAAADGTASAAAAGTATRNVEVRDEQGWFTVCCLDDLTPGRGVAALLRDGSQAAVFLDRVGRTYVIGNRDPFTGAYVLSRGLLGSAAGAPAGAGTGAERAGNAPFVASPLLKQRFDLRTGNCLDDDGVSVPVFRSRTR
jgi:nitrite reductase (NADH) small subunit